jgi:AraC-like DNA-binding protein
MREFEKKFLPIDKYQELHGNGENRVLILDCGFHIKKGLRLLKELKEAFPSTPIIFLTDTGSEDAAINAFRAGAREYFRKPVNLTDIQETVNNLLRIKNTSLRERMEIKKRRPRSEGGTVVPFHSDMPQNILRSISFIEEQLHELKNISLDVLAGKANISKYHFCRAFKKTTGMTPMKYVNHLRVQRAKELLRRDDWNISNIAIESGFQYLSNFNRQFRKLTGFTPTSYKDSIQR